MKNYTDEDKAKAYDKFVKELKSKFKDFQTIIYDKNDLEKFFPELAESEDERIRKELISYIKQINYDNLHTWNGINLNVFIAWLKKQDNANKEYWRGYREGKQEILDKYAELEKQSEQKLADKVEPKFHEGDWIVFNGLTLLVKEVVKGYYKTISIGGIPNSCDWNIDNAARLWTIQDAKDGDVLATLDYILIFKEFLKDDGGISYCHYNFGAGNPQFIWFEDENWYFGKEAIIHPATKEQRDTLMKAMADSGYTFDFEKKELKNIEPIFNVADKNVKVY